MGQMETPFAQRFLAVAAERGPLCVGIDPAPDTLREWGLADDIEGVRAFCRKVTAVASGRVAIVKPQSAFFERYGPAGMEELRRTVDAAHAGGALVLIDAKRGDISSTVRAYAEAFLGKGSAFGADALTATPYLGLGSLEPLFTHAQKVGCGVFVVVRSSNPEGASIQRARGADGREVAETLAEEITRLNGDATIGAIGAVLGATLGAELGQVAALLPKSLLLCPGIGAQGASVEGLATDLGVHSTRAMPAVSRALYATPDGLEQAVTVFAAQVRILQAR
jgi:orotidine-5'-phosphate decarboxylase